MSNPLLFSLSRIQINRRISPIPNRIPSNAFNPDIEKKEIKINGVDGGNIFDLGGYLNELKYFTDCIKARKPIGKATLEDGVQALKFVLDEVYERE